MAKKAKTPTKEQRIRDAAAAFYSQLDEDSWGNINPYLFRWIGEGASKENVGEENWDSMVSLKEALARVLKISPAS